jgi:hypothetical protein
MCKLCETKPVYEFTNQRRLCKNCFIRWFQKKSLYTIRKFELIQRGDVVGFQKKEEFRDVVLEEILKMFGEKTGVELVKLPSKKKLNKIAFSSSTDLEAERIINFLIKSKGKLNYPKQGKNIFPLYLFLDKEILLYAKLKKLKFEKTKDEKDKISIFIDEMEKKHPEVKQAIVKSYLKK